MEKMYDIENLVSGKIIYLNPKNHLLRPVYMMRRFVFEKRIDENGKLSYYETFTEDKYLPLPDDRLGSMTLGWRYVTSIDDDICFYLSEKELRSGKIPATRLAKISHIINTAALSFTKKNRKL